MAETYSETQVLSSYLRLRYVLGGLGMGLPLILLVWGLHSAHTVLPTISDYYALRARDVFVGTLFAIGFFLYTYHGRKTIDNVLTNVAGVCALGVALFPVTGTRVDHVLHIASATGLFLLLAAIAIVVFPRFDGPVTPRKYIRNTIYRTCGYAILACIILIFVYDNTGLDATGLASVKPVFILESLSLFAFGVAWFAKGGMLLWDAEPGHIETAAGASAGDPA